MVEKKNPDYESSAINLCNPDEVRLALIDLHEAQYNLQGLQTQADAMVPPELSQGIFECQELVGKLTKDVRIAIELYGSYQNVEDGRYALQQLKRSPVYHVTPFKEHYEKFAGAVIEETINKKALEGLVKGGLIEQADLEVFKVVTYDETRAFIIK